MVRNKGLELSNCEYTAFWMESLLPYRIKYLKYLTNHLNLLIHGMMASSTSKEVNKTYL